MDKIQMERIIIYMSGMCNLRCKICHEYIPYISSNPPYYSSEQIKKALYEYFQIVSHVKMLTISGGEPFLSGNTEVIVEFLSQFKEQYDKLEIMTNGTLLPSERLLQACMGNEKSSVFINHYGNLSPEAEAISEICAKRGIHNIVRKYFGEDAHCGGWFDLEILSGERMVDYNELTDRFQNCLTGNNPRLGLSFGLFGGSLFACSVSGIVARLGLLDGSKSCVDLCDDSLSYEKKRDCIVALKNREFLPACAICHGNDSRIVKKRFPPAEQLS